MELEEFIQRIERFQNTRRQALEANLLTTGMDATQILQDRLQEKGIDEDGTAFDDYTIPYRKRKELKGRYKGIRDFTDSGDMLRNIQPRLEVDSNRITVIVGPERSSLRDRMAYNVNHVGKPLLRLSDQERAELIEDFKERYYNDAKRILQG